MRALLAPVVVLLCQACGAPSNGSSEPAQKDPRAPACTPAEQADTPTYSELFERYFAPGTPGHCATAHCHANPGFNEWLCGDTKDSCYSGMVAVGLIDTEQPAASLIGNPTQSPLSWINPTGSMPFDATGPFPEGREAILAWVRACARND